MSRGRPRAFDRDKALRDAMLVFWRKSYNATSVRDLTEALGIGMPSLYSSFGCKEDLFVAAAVLYMQDARKIWQVMEGLPPRAAIEAVLHATARELSDAAAHPTGCMIMNAFVDENMPAAVAQAIRQGRRDWNCAIHKQLERALAAGEISSAADIPGLTNFFAGIVQAIGVQAHDGAPVAALSGMVDVAMGAWPAAGPKQG